MFAKFARFISRYWIWVLVAWVILPIGMKLVAPKWDDITHDGDFAYLPRTLTSVRGEELMGEAFPELTAKSSVVLVVARPGDKLSGDDKAVAGWLATMFTPKDEQKLGMFARLGAKFGPKSPVLSVLSYREDDVVGRKLISRRTANGQAVLVILQLNNEFMAVDNMAFIKRVYAKVAELRQDPGLRKDAELRQYPKLPDGLELGVTGTAPVGADMLESMKESIDNTELTTIILVTVILLVVYRAPGLVLVPLLSIAVSFVVSIDLIGLVAKWCDMHHWDFQIFKTTQIFIVVVLFGAATDYCLFLIARYREELQRGLGPREAVEEALGQTGHALTASAMTTILGLGAMIFADFGKYRSGGPTIAISLVVALIACMTVAPAMLRAMGRAVFWPFGVGGVARSREQGAGSKEQGTGGRERGAGNPALLPAPCSPLPAPIAESAPLPQTIMGRFWIVVSRVIVTHPGLILVGSFLVLAIPAWHGSNVPITYDMLAELNQKRESVQGMELLKKHFLVGETGPIVVLAYHRGGDFDTQAERVKITRLAMELKDFTYKKGQPIDHIRCLTNPLGDVLKRKKGLGAFMVRGTASSTIESKHLFLSSGEHAGEVTRFELVTNFDPFSQESIEFLDNVDEWLNFQSRSDKFWGRVFVACSDWKDVDFDFVGATAQIRDLDAVNRSDTFWVGVYVALAVLIVLIFLTRKPLISLYLIFTVVFGYLVSLGLTHLFFSWYYAGLYHGLDWKLKIFLFVILVAVGEDYNIYLVTRVFEEQRRRGPLEGLREAVIRTGGIITSCGVIMAGTFGSMATGTLRSMIELGFAMSLGVLLDTFIIRTILVPSFLALLARWGIGGAPGTPGPVESRGDARPASRPGVPGARPDAPTAPHYESVANDLAQSSK